MRIKKLLAAFAVSLLLLAMAAFTLRERRPPGEAELAETLARAEENLAREMTEIPVTEEEFVEDAIAPGPTSSLAAQEPFGFEGIAPREKSIFELAAEKQAEERRPKPINLPGTDYTAPKSSLMDEDDYAALSENNQADEYGGINGSHMSMILTPVKSRVIGSAAEYNKFKKTAFGPMPEVDFNKQGLLVLESDSEMPDNIFEIDEVVQTQDGTTVYYRVNVLGLKKREYSHALAPVRKNEKNLVLKQIR
jgi:hypothetical protein